MMAPLIINYVKKKMADLEEYGLIFNIISSTFPSDRCIVKGHGRNE